MQIQMDAGHGRGASTQLRPRTRWLTVAATATIVFAACGRGTTTNEALSPKYCDAVKTIANYDDGLRGDGAPEQIKAAYARVTADLAAPLATVESEGPEKVKGAVTGLRGALEKSRDEGTEAFDVQVESQTTIVESSAGGCRWQQQSITALDYRYQGVPSTWKAGTFAVTLNNRSDKEPHLFLVARVKDGVTKPIDELLSQFQGPETPPDADIEFINGGAFAPPMSSATGLLELRAGRYIYLCPLPVDGAKSETEDHASRGMKGEFRVS